MGHDTHSHESAGRLTIVAFLNFLITTVEVAGGILSCSLSLLSDALHNLSDGIAVLMSLAALKISEKGSTSRHTFGYKRAEVLAAAVNSSVLIVITLYLFWEAYRRFIFPTSVNGSIIVPVALIGLTANVFSTLLLKKGSSGSMNIRAAYLHLLSDAFSSVAVIVGGVIMWLYGMYWIDPLLTVLIGLYIMYEGIDILKDSLHVFMEGAPDIDIDELRGIIEAQKGVENIHHLHIWNVGEHDIYLAAHVMVEDIKVSETEKISQAIKGALKEKYGIDRVLIQFECSSCGSDSLIPNCGSQKK